MEIMIVCLIYGVIGLSVYIGLSVEHKTFLDNLLSACIWPIVLIALITAKLAR